MALDVLAGIGAEARQALADEPNAFQVLARYMHRADALLTAEQL